MVVLGFDWDEHNFEKCQKHGVSIVEIEFILRSNPLVSPDIEHSEAEERFLAIGKNGAGRAAFIVFTIRDTDRGRLIRPISARYMHQREIAAYDQPSFKNDH